VLRLAIVGSVKFRSPELQWEAERLVWKYIRENGNSIEVMISGGAPGIDSIAEYYADYYSIPKRIHLPENKRWAPNGFRDRNLKIAGDCTHLLCVRDSASRTYGSGWTSDRAKEMGKVVWRYDL
jgi:predicted Rossmann fold nucleotide-binding protein DprA/Smf involved in DNA uptake